MLDLRKSVKALGLAAIGALILSPVESRAICEGKAFNPLADICFSCMFPARIGGMGFRGSAGDIPPGETNSPACACPTATSVRLGITVSFWEHARVIETIKDPYCFPSLGYTSISNSASHLKAGDQTSAATAGATSSTSPVHHLILPLWTMLNLFSDMPCVEKRPFDIAFMSEWDEMWTDDEKAFLINPEAILMGNPITQLSCAADTAAATVASPLDPLFWCFGAWGSAYPLSGTTSGTEPVDTNALLAARMIYKLGREGILRDVGMPGITAQCAPDGVLSPIMVKSHYRFQIAKPRRGNDCVPVGRPSFVWGVGKNPPVGAGKNSPDNFMWVMTRKRSCCVGYTL